MNTFAGIPDSTFTDRSAELILADYEKHGIPLQIDLEHLSLDDQSANFNPDSMGCGELEVRRDANGGPELWLTNIKWAPEGSRRIKAKSQRYWSPVFRREPESGEITALFNLGLVASPATDNLQPLIAASSRSSFTRGKAMDPESMDVALIAEGMGLDLPGLAKALGLDPASTLEDIAAAMAVVSDKLSKIAGLGPAPAPAEETPAEGEPEPEAAADAPASEDEDKAELQAARMVLLRDTNTKSTSEALSVMASWKAAYVAQEATKAKLAKERALLEAAERRSIGATLVKAGLAPAMVWADDSAKTLSAPFQAMNIEALRAYAAKAGAQPAALTAAPQAPTGNAHGLTDRELHICSQLKTDPAVYAANKARLMAAKAAR